MPTDLNEQGFSLPHRLLRLAHAVEDINSRIARLTQNLHLNLSHESDLHHVFQLEGNDSNPHHQARLKELRGLVVLRYDMVRHYCEALGYEATHTLLSYTEQQLRGSGFDPVVSGADARHLCGEA